MINIDERPKVPSPLKICAAVHEIVKAREILERPYNAPWGTPTRGVLDELAKTLVGKLHEQAADLSDKRQYREAEAAVTLGQRLSPKDEQLSEVLAKITTLKSDPKSANISGTWVCHEDGNALEMMLTDNGANAVAWRLSEAGGGGRQTTGSFTRTGAAMDGTRPFEMRGVPGQLTVKARIETADTIVVQSSVFTPSAPNRLLYVTTRNIPGRGRQREKRRRRTNPKSERHARPAPGFPPATLECGHRPQGENTEKSVSRFDRIFEPNTMSSAGELLRQSEQSMECPCRWLSRQQVLGERGVVVCLTLDYARRRSERHREPNCSYRINNHHDARKRRFSHGLVLLPEQPAVRPGG